MSRKTDLLIKEIARLLYEFKASEWMPVLTQLKTGSEIQKQISLALEELIYKAEQSAQKRPQDRTKVRKTSSASSQISRKKFEVSPSRAKALEPLRDAIVSRRVLRTAPNLHAVLQELGVKQDPYNDRREAADQLIRHLDGLDRDRFQESMQIVSKHLSGQKMDLLADYTRWFEVITGQTKGQFES